MNSNKNQAASASPSRRPTYEFEGFRLDGQYRVLRRPTGESVPLPPKAFDTLLHFVERPGELLDKRSLLQAVWPHVVVEENNLTQCISLLRRTLGEEPFEHRFLVTEPGRGYRFVATVTTLEDADAAATPPPEVVAALPAAPTHAGRRRRVIAAAAAAVLLLVACVWYLSIDGAAARLPNSLAVLPFENLSPNPDDAYFAAGIHTELVGRLSKLRGLNVIAETSVRRYAGNAQSIQEIAEQLRVGAVMEGSVRYSNDEVRITVNLVDAATEASRWSEVYDRPLSDVFGVQADIAENIVAALESEFSLDERESLARPPTASPEAYALYLQASNLRPDLGERDRLLQRAISLDPSFAAAYALRAQNYAFSLVNTQAQFATPAESAEFGRRVEELAARALELDPTQTVAYGALGMTYRNQWRWRQAFDVYERGRALDPSFVEGSWLYAMVGNHARANELIQRGLRLNPLDPIAHEDAGVALMWAGRAEDAILAYRRAIVLRSDDAVPHYLLAQAYIRIGRRNEALEELRIARQLWGEGFLTLPAAPPMAYSYARLGDREEARRLIAEHERLVPRAGNADRSALAYLALDDHAGALRSLERSIDRAKRHEPDPNFIQLMAIKLNGPADPVLELPSFVEARRRLTGD